MKIALNVAEMLLFTRTKFHWLTTKNGGRVPFHRGGRWICKLGQTTRCVQIHFWPLRVAEDMNNMMGFFNTVPLQQVLMSSAKVLHWIPPMAAIFVWKIFSSAAESDLSGDWTSATLHQMSRCFVQTELIDLTQTFRLGRPSIIRQSASLINCRVHVKGALCMCNEHLRLDFACNASLSASSRTLVHSRPIVCSLGSLQRQSS